MNKQLLQTAKPILFNTEMVKAILDGRKAQTRRVVGDKLLNEIYKNDCYIYDGQIFESCMCQCDPDGSGGLEVDRWEEDVTTTYSKYKVGDILYVRETFVLEGMTYDENGEIIHHKESIIHYKADEKELNWVDEWENECNIPWKPSIHMPKKYARIFLKIINVKVERLQDITRKDVLSEGIREHAVNQFHPHTCLFETLWNSTAKDGYKWEDNPYVFVYEFEKVEVC